MSAPHTPPGAAELRRLLADAALALHRDPRAVDIVERLCDAADRLRDGARDAAAHDPAPTNRLR